MKRKFTFLSPKHESELLALLLTSVCERTHTNKDDLLGKSRTFELMYPRYIFVDVAVRCGCRIESAIKILGRCRVMQYHYSKTIDCLKFCMKDFVNLSDELYVTYSRHHHSL